MKIKTVQLRENNENITLTSYIADGVAGYNAQSERESRLHLLSLQEDIMPLCCIIQ